jgi:N-acetylmuramic acid 6-phosphate (MurNAc-6-P) etherase
MKSGTATGIILQLLMFCSFARYGVLTDEELSQIGFSSERTLDSMRQFLLQYETARNCAYLESDHLADIIELAGDALKAGRNIYYLGSGNHGILGLIDASECPPTYGATFEDVRGYLAGGWSTLLPDGVEPPKASIPEDDSLFSFDLPDFESQKLPQVGEGDLVIGIGKANMNAEVQRLVKAAKAQGAKTAAILATPEHGHDWLDVDIFLPLTMPMPGYVKGGSAFSEMAMKLILNGITTGAHVLAGKVFSNYMIDLRITNSKLYERAIKIICKLMEVNRHHAETSLLSAIYQTDSLHPAQAQAPVSQHVATAAPRGKVVPAAMLIATGNFSCSEAEQALAKEPIIRQLLEQYLTNR